MKDFLTIVISRETKKHKSTRNNRPAGVVMTYATFLRDIQHVFLTICFFFFFNFILTRVYVSPGNSDAEAPSRVFIFFTVFGISMDVEKKQSGIGESACYTRVFSFENDVAVCTRPQNYDCNGNHEKHFIYTRVVWDRTQISEKTWRIVSRPGLDSLPPKFIANPTPFNSLIGRVKFTVDSAWKRESIELSSIHRRRALKTTF